MRTSAVLLAVALVLAVAAPPAAAIIHKTRAEAHGQCHDGDGNGGGGSVGAFPANGQVDAVDPEEALSIAEGLQVFAEGTAANAQAGDPGGDACPADDTNQNGNEAHDSEDHVSAEAYALNENVHVGVCYDDEGFHATAQCHQGPGQGGALPSGSVILP